MNYEMLVNKNNQLDKTYIPKDLVNAKSKYRNNAMVNKTVLDNFLNMKHDMSLLGYDIDIMSGYRDYNYQNKIYNKSIHDKGYAYTLRSIAQPGYSEHQTGLAIDICIYKNNKVYIEKEIINMPEFKYLKYNSYKYGFILRYPEDKEDITGYNYEPCHYRYVGIDLARYLYHNHLTLEEYYDKKDNNSNNNNNYTIFVDNAKL